MAKNKKVKKENLMNGQLHLKATIFALFIALFVSFVLCIFAGILFGWSMYKAWAPLLPGFEWPVTPGGFLVGAIWIIGYSIYFGILYVYPYNYFLIRGEK